MSVPARTEDEKLAIIQEHCMGCANVRVQAAQEKTLRTVTCPKSCGCPGGQQKALFDLLDAKMFKCRAGIHLDYRHAELTRQSQL